VEDTLVAVSPIARTSSTPCAATSYICTTGAKLQDEIDRNLRTELSPCLARGCMEVGAQDQERVFFSSQAVRTLLSTVKATSRAPDRDFDCNFDNFKSSD
jgi:hypothetical protein